MNEYRCTRNDPYSNPRCPGHADRTARQGYYVDAKTADEARAEMARDFPRDVGGFTHIDAEAFGGERTARYGRRP